MKKLSEIQDYDLEIESIVKTINKEKCKRVLLQFPDGLKPYATAVVDELEKKTKAEFLIWMGSCFGACDIPTIPKEMKIDLVVQFGHSKNFKFLG